MCISRSTPASSVIIRNPNFSNGFYAASQLHVANQQNYVASPVSVLMLLSALLGAKGPQGETADQLCQAIKGNTDKCSASIVAEIRQNAEKTMRQLMTARSVAEPTEKVVKIANAAFVQKDLMLKSSFESEFEKDNVSTIAKIDFLSPEAYKTVNAWVNRTTGGLINEIFKSPNDISKDVLMMLLNSVYFKDEWQKHFLSAKVKDRTFRTLSSEKTVKMMRENEYILYYSDEVRGFKLVAKPFSNERFQFVVILPTEDLKIEKLNALFKEGFDWTVLKKASEKQIELFLPRFKLEHEVDLVPTLQSMGVRNLFSKGLADLSGITTEAMLYVGAAKQNAILEVTEAGVKAAAVSSMQIMPMSLRPKGEPFIVDQPFFCAVYDMDLMLPLFLARVMDPQPV